MSMVVGLHGHSGQIAILFAMADYRRESAIAIIHLPAVEANRVWVIRVKHALVTLTHAKANGLVGANSVHAAPPVVRV